MDGFDDFGVGGIGFYLFAELGDVLVEGAAVRKVIHAPGVIVELVAGDHLGGTVVEELQDFEVAQGELDFVVVAEGAQFGGKDFEGAKGEVGAEGGFLF